MPPAKKKKSPSKKLKKKFSRDALLQSGIAGGITFLLVLTIALSSTFNAHPSDATVSSEKTEKIGLEYQGAVHVLFDIGRKKTVGYLVLTGDPKSSINISLPEEWHRTEVRGVPLKSVTADVSAFGFTRWTLPAGASMTMTIPDVPDLLNFESPSPGLATIAINAIDIETNNINPQAILLKGKSTVHLWEE